MHLFPLLKCSLPCGSRKRPPGISDFRGIFLRIFQEKEQMLPRSPQLFYNNLTPDIYLLKLPALHQGVYIFLLPKIHPPFFDAQFNYTILKLLLPLKYRLFLSPYINATVHSALQDIFGRSLHENPRQLFYYFNSVRQKGLSPTRNSSRTPQECTFVLDH